MGAGGACLEGGTGGGGGGGMEGSVGGGSADAGFRCVLLWGFEWWYDVKTRKGDAAMWDAVKEEAAKFLGDAAPPPDDAKDADAKSDGYGEEY